MLCKLCESLLVNLRLFFFLLYTTYTADSALLCPKGQMLGDARLSSRPTTPLVSHNSVHTFMRKKKKQTVPLVLRSVGAGPGCSVCGRGQGDALLVHSFGLRAHDEAEEVLVWDGRPSNGWRGRGTALVIQTGPLVELEEGRERQSEVWLWTLELFIITGHNRWLSNNFNY